MARYFIRLSYCGTGFNGWQAQPHVNTKTIQGVLEKSLSVLHRADVSITGCGRTDTGVHAKDYIAHFDFPIVDDIPFMIFKLNKMLPAQIAVHDIILMHDQAHARFDATSRSYLYHLHTEKLPFAHQSFYYTYGTIPNLQLMNEAASVLLQYTDFTTFCKEGTDVKTKICQLTECYWIQEGNQFTFRITSDRFLRGMIRLIVGMCLQVSRGKVTIQEVRHALETKSKIGLDWAVPAIGLTLCDVKYPYL